VLHIRPPFVKSLSVFLSVCAGMHGYKLGGPGPRVGATGRMLTAECFVQDSDL